MPLVTLRSTNLTGASISSGNQVSNLIETVDYLLRESINDYS